MGAPDREKGSHTYLQYLQSLLINTSSCSSKWSIFHQPTNQAINQSELDLAVARGIHLATPSTCPPPGGERRETGALLYLGTWGRDPLFPELHHAPLCACIHWGGGWW